MPINKAWSDCAALNPRGLPGTVGVYELADAQGEVIFIGYAGGRALMGLRGEIAAHCGGKETFDVTRSRVARFRYEVTASYLTRWLELLARYRQDTGVLPPGNASAATEVPPLTRYGWKTGA